jgi:hypothetical protein
MADFMFSLRYSSTRLIEVRIVTISVCEANSFVSVSPFKSVDTSVAAVNRLRTCLPMNWASFPGRDERFYSSTKLQDRLWGQPGLLFSGQVIRCSCRRGIKRPEMDSTSPYLIMAGNVMNPRDDSCFVSPVHLFFMQLICFHFLQTLQRTNNCCMDIMLKLTALGILFWVLLTRRGDIFALHFLVCVL